MSNVSTCKPPFLLRKRNEIRSKMSERDYQLWKAQRTGKENDLAAYRRLRNTVTRLIRHSKATYTRSVLRENVSRPTEFWSQIKRCYLTKSSKGNNCKLFEINGKKETDEKVISNAFCAFLHRLETNYAIHYHL